MTDLLENIGALPAPERRFHGDTYDAAQDCTRLTGQLLRVLRVFRQHKGEWLTLAHIAQEAQCPEASASARYRDLKRPAFGAWPMERQRRPGGLYVYRLAA